MHWLIIQVVQFFCESSVASNLVLKQNSKDTSISYTHLTCKRDDYFKELLESQNRLKLLLGGKKKVTLSEKAQEASYLVVVLTAPKSKGKTLVKNLTKPSMEYSRE